MAVFCHASLYAYSLPFAQPMHWRGQSYTARQGYVIQLQDKTGQSYWGEVSPLPGFSRESLSFVEMEIKNYFALWALTGDAPKTVQSPSVAFGLSCAKEMLMEGVTAQKIRSSEIALPSSYPLLSVDTLSDYIQSTRMFDVKLKVNPQNLDKAINVINQSVEHAKQRLRCRIDANRSLSFAQAVRLVSDIPSSALYYFEEPLSSVAELDEFVIKTGAPIALDESLQQATYWDECKRLKGVKAWVIKPMLCGGLDDVKNKVDFANAHEIEVVISSVYEGLIGWTQLCILANKVAPNRPAGLDTQKAFARPYTAPVNITAFSTTQLATCYPGIECIACWEGEMRVAS